MDMNNVAQRIDGRGQLNVFAVNARQDLMIIDANYTAHADAFDGFEFNFINLCVAGGGVIEQDTEAQRLRGQARAGSFGLAPACRSGEGRWPSMRAIHLGLSREHFASILAEDEAGSGFPAEASLNTMRKDPVVAFALHTIVALARLGDISSSYCDHLTAVALCATVRAGGPRKAPTPQILPLDTRRLKRVTECIEDRLVQDVGVGELAALAGLSRSHFTRAFQSATGVAPYAYINHRRATRAVDYLSNSQLNITEIAHMVGCSNSSQFAALFKRNFGVSPSEWRRRA